jgi:hypothetical protein
MLEGWHEFYLLLGTAAATLMALLFVAASVGVGILRTERADATRAFMSPVALHFTIVLVTSLITLAPIHDTVGLAILIALAAAAGFACTIAVMPRHFREGVEWADRVSYGIMPLFAYALAVAAAFLLGKGFDYAPHILAVSQVLLLVDNIRNAWDLTIYLVRQHRPEQ